MIFQIKRNDTSPGMTRTLRRADGSLADLTGAMVRFHMANPETGVVIVDRPAFIIGPTTGGRVGYAWQAVDTATQGQFDAEYEVTFSDGTIETFPNGGFIRVLIGPDLA